MVTLRVAVMLCFVALFVLLDVVFVLFCALCLLVAFCFVLFCFCLFVCLF